MSAIKEVSVPAAPRAAAALGSLNAAIASLAEGLAPASANAGVARWRALGELLNARKAFVNHASACESTSGPFSQVVVQKPRLQSRVRRMVDDHRDIRFAFDQLIGRLSGDSAAEVSLRDLEPIIHALQRHRAQSTDVAFEWANRDIGGEG